MKRNDALRRLAQRALAGSESLPPLSRASLFEDAAQALNGEERELALTTAFSLRECAKLQHDFLDKLK